MQDEPTRSDVARDERAPRSDRLDRRDRPAFVVVPLDCEVTAYAPFGDDPLF